MARIQPPWQPGCMRVGCRPVAVRLWLVYGSTEWARALLLHVHAARPGAGPASPSRCAGSWSAAAAPPMPTRATWSSRTRSRPRRRAGGREDGEAVGSPTPYRRSSAIYASALPLCSVSRPQSSVSSLYVCLLHGAHPRTLLLPKQAVEVHCLTVPHARRAGTVRLGGHRTASATVEATFAAAAPGALPVPQLHLHDVSQLEVFDDGASPDFVMVAS